MDADSTLVEAVPGMSDLEHLTTLCLFARERDLFIYAECADPIWTPERLLESAAELLEPWPGAEKPRRWIPMMDIFHYQRCVAVERWQRREPPVNRWGRVVRLRPEKVSSYIFYHYQMQEEESKNDSIFGTIGIHENLLFFYTEEPNFVTGPFYRRVLETHNTPRDWAGTMEPHFAPWPDAKPPIWRDCRLIAAI